MVWIFISFLIRKTLNNDHPSLAPCEEGLLLHQQLKLHASFCVNFDNYLHNDHISCTCSIRYEIDPSSVSFDLGEDLISYLDACD